MSPTSSPLLLSSLELSDTTVYEPKGMSPTSSSLLIWIQVLEGPGA